MLLVTAKWCTSLCQVSSANQTTMSTSTSAMWPGPSRSLRDICTTADDASGSRVFLCLVGYLYGNDNSKLVQWLLLCGNRYPRWYRISERTICHSDPPLVSLLLLIFTYSMNLPLHNCWQHAKQLCVLVRLLVGAFYVICPPAITPNSFRGFCYMTSGVFRGAFGGGPHRVAHLIF